MDIDKDDFDVMDMSIWIKKGTWWGLSLGHWGMAENSDMISVSSNSFQVDDKHSAGYQYPATDVSQDVKTVGTADLGDFIRYDVKRPLDTNDDKDFVFQLNRTSYFGWVGHTTTSDLTRKHNTSGRFKIILKEPEPEPEPEIEV